MDITIHGNTAEIVQEQMIKGGYQSPDDVVYEAVELLIKQKINNNIQCGLSDIEAGDYQVLTKDNMADIAQYIVNQAQQK